MSEFTNKDLKILKSLTKSISKSFCKAMISNKRKIIEDVLDDDFDAEVPEKDLVESKAPVMNKNKYCKKELSAQVAEKIVKKYREYKKQSLKE